jgi:flavin-binding protein dodecin
MLSIQDKRQIRAAQKYGKLPGGGENHMTNRDDYVNRLKSQLDQWNTQMTAWESAARQARSDARSELEKQIGIMRSRLDDMVFRMELLKGASTTAWQEIANGADEARKAMQDAVEKARTRFKDV